MTVKGTPTLLCTWCDPPTPIEPTCAGFKKHRQCHLVEHRHTRGDDLPLALECNPGIAIRMGFACRTCGLVTRGNRTKGNHPHDMEPIFVTAMHWGDSKSIRELVLSDGLEMPSQSEMVSRMATDYESNVCGRFQCIDTVFETGLDYNGRLPSQLFSADSEIRLADMYRAYRQRGDVLDLQTAHGALLPDQYEFMNCEAAVVCSVKSCSKVYETCQELGRHFSVAHAFWALNDRLDGTLSLVGKCSGPRPIVVSRKAPGHDDTAARPSANRAQAEAQAEAQVEASPQANTGKRPARVANEVRQPAQKRQRRSFDNASTEIPGNRDDGAKNRRETTSKQTEIMNPLPSAWTLPTPQKTPVKGVHAGISASAGKQVLSDIRDLQRQAELGVPFDQHYIQEYLSICIPPDSENIQLVEPGQWKEWRDHGVSLKNTPKLEPGNYLVIPAYKEDHWYAIIVSRKPGSEDDVLFSFLDPLERDHFDDCGLLLSYVQQAMACSVCKPDFMSRHARYIPRLTELADSGVYMLAYISQFVKAPERTMQTILDNHDLGWDIDPAVFRRKTVCAIKQMHQQRLFESYKQTLNSAVQRITQGLEANESHFPQLRNQMRAFGLDIMEQFSSPASNQDAEEPAKVNGEGPSSPVANAPQADGGKNTALADSSVIHVHDAETATNKADADRQRGNLDKPSFRLEPFWSRSPSPDDV